MRIYPLRCSWEPLPAKLGNAQERLRAALLAWERTPYVSGQRCRGVAADCIGGVFGVIDDVDGRPRAQDPLLPSDTSLHDSKAAYRAVAALRRIYAPSIRLRECGPELRLQPGDLLVVGTSAGGPGHLMIVGAQKNTIWHASNSRQGFCRSGWCLGDGYERLFSVYRLGDRERWAR